MNLILREQQASSSRLHKEGHVGGKLLGQKMCWGFQWKAEKLNIALRLMRLQLSPAREITHLDKKLSITKKKKRKGGEACVCMMGRGRRKGKVILVI